MKNPPAFPKARTSGTNEDGFHFESEGQDGMTLLDYFAGQALQGIAITDLGADIIAEKIKQAYLIGALMLEEREKYIK